MKETELHGNQLLADAGATKTEWCYVPNGVCSRCYLPGINANTATDDDVRRNLSSLLTELKIDATTVEQISFFGAGCGNPINAARMSDLLKAAFPNATIEVYSDLMCACRAVCADKPGIVGILGTGASSCLYDGEKIVAQAPSLGWLLGDEGSGTYLGKMLVTAYLQNELSDVVNAEFERRYGFTQQQLVREVATQSNPRQFFASFAPFVEDYLSDLSVKSLCLNAFNEYFRRFVCRYDNYQKYTLNLVGSIAYAFRNVISEVAQNHQVSIGNIAKAPMEILVEKLCN